VLGAAHGDAPAPAARCCNGGGGGAPHVSCLDNWR
jgi:hypothetical protein